MRSIDHILTVAKLQTCMWGSGPEITWSDVPPTPTRGV